MRILRMSFSKKINRMNYKEQFSKRATSYFSAMSNYPRAMAEEFQTAVNALELQGGETVVNIPAGCVNLEQFLDSTIQYRPFEIVETFAKHVGQEVCSLSEIPCEASSVDHVISVAGLHHSSDEERREFYKEVKRILKPNGLLVIADVQKGSSQDKWLNEFVDTYNTFGHKGQFWSEEDKKRLEESGFSVTVSEKTYAWRFDSKQDMLAFSKDLFYLDKANLAQIEEGLTEILQADSTTIPWKLLYFVCRLCP
jgi:SAM-dependent methyltransferase